MSLVEPERAAARPSRAARYREHALAAVPRLLGSLDREPLSPTSGSFDRDHWGWYFRDVPIGMLQTGILPLAALWAGDWPSNPYARVARLHGWIVDAIEQSLKRQHRNGSFDSVGPNTQDHGVTLQMVHTLSTALRYLDGSVPGALTTRVADAVRRGCAFAARSDEDYAFISNHHALFALAWLRGGTLLNDEALIRRAEREVRDIVNRQAPEGWYPEYDGADPGYQSLGMSYLSQFQREHASPELAESLRRAVEFMSHFVHPDGGFGGVYGSRMTSLWFPSGFEEMAREHPLAAAVADAVAEGIESANVVTPATTDVHNLPVILHSYLLAADAGIAREAVPSPASPPLPRETLSGARRLGESGIVVGGSPHYYAVLNLRRGGTGAIHSRTTSALVFEDAGYVIRAGTTMWSSAIPTSVEISGPDNEGTCSVTEQVGVVNRLPLTPGRFLVLRLLNLTLFRSIGLGAFIRRRLVNRLITRRQGGPFTLRRQVRFQSDGVYFHDILQRTSASKVDQLTRARAFSPVHMGSSRYFHGRDLLGASDVDEAEAAKALESTGTADLRTEVAF